MNSVFIAYLSGIYSSLLFVVGSAITLILGFLLFKTIQEIEQEDRLSKKSIRLIALALFLLIIWALIPDQITMLELLRVHYGV